jgi:hypothetical protein
MNDVKGPDVGVVGVVGAFGFVSPPPEELPPFIE